MKSELPPCVFNIYKPAGITSYDVLRHFKRNLDYKFSKVGHFGTLDPFAEGVLLIAFSRASRLNNYVHEGLNKTYIADGILGLETDTGDLTVEPRNKDESDYLNNEISQFSKEFIEERLNEKFLGDYWQAPHKFSAAKFEGKKLYEYAREGVEVKKEKKLRKVYKIEILDYQFPKLKIRFEASSGTYIRTLFSDCANYLGTLGTLEKLYREKIGSISMDESLKKEQWPLKGEGWDWKQFAIPMTGLLPFAQVQLPPKQVSSLSHGVAVSFEGSVAEDDLCWAVNNSSHPLALGIVKNQRIKPLVNFSS